MRRDYRISVDDTVAKAERIRAAKKAEKQVRKSAKRLGEAEEQEKTAKKTERRIKRSAKRILQARRKKKAE